MEEMLAGKSWATKAAKVLHKPNSPSSLEAIWKHGLAGLMESKFIKLTGAEIGQLKHFAKACPPGKADAVLSWAMDNWSLFAKNAEDAAGLKNSPTMPVAGFLLKHANVAMMLWQSATEPKKPTVTISINPIPKPVFVPEPVQLTSHEPPPCDTTDGMSMKELWAEPDEE